MYTARKDMVYPVEYTIPSGPIPYPGMVLGGGRYPTFFLVWVRDLGGIYHGMVYSWYHTVGLLYIEIPIYIVDSSHHSRHSSSDSYIVT